MPEGETTGLIDLGYCTKKYTHHPIAVAYEIMEDKRFRHLSIERLHELIAIWGPVRSPRWNDAYSDDFSRALDKVQIDPKQTIRPVAILGGLSCMCCDGMAWEVPVISKENRHTYNWIPETVEEAFKELTLQQYTFSSLWDSYHELLPTLCPQCFAKTRKVRRTNDGYEYNKVHALKCLAELTKQTGGANNENRPTQSRKRRINSR
jgi:hypothetical protein